MSGEGVAHRYFSYFRNFPESFPLSSYGCLIATAAAKNGLQDTVASNQNLRSMKSGRKREGETLSTRPTLDKLCIRSLTRQEPTSCVSLD